MVATTSRVMRYESDPLFCFLFLNILELGVHLFSGRKIRYLINFVLFLLFLVL